MSYRKSNIKILHITDQLSKGGAGRALIGVAKYSTKMGDFHHQCVSIKPLFDDVVDEVVHDDLKIHVAPSRSEITTLMEEADIVQWHWWQNIPLMWEKLPSKPNIVWCAVSGEYPPNELTPDVVEFADVMVITNPMTRDLPAIRSLSEFERQCKVKLIFESADFARILPVNRIPHENFNIGWIGTIAAGKFNTSFVKMSNKISLPDARFIVCGEGPLKSQAIHDVNELKDTNRFRFMGYQNDIRKMIGSFDVYGFPLDEKTFAGGELNLQEVMVSGIPPVVFPYGGPKRMILHNYNGLIAYSEDEYKEHIEFLYHHPEERERLGSNARDYALREFGAENAAKKYNRLYEEIIAQQKPAVSEIVSYPSEVEKDSEKRLALFYKKKGNIEKAIKHARSILRNDPDDFEMQAILAMNDEVICPTDIVKEQKSTDELEKMIDTRVYPTYKVTAIVSTYNSDNVFLGCLSDLFEQSLYKKGELEIVIIDSASPGSEWDILEKFYSEFKHILAVRTTEREGLYKAWNRAIRLSTGTLISNANTDDRHYCEALEILSTTLKTHSEVAIVYADSLVSCQINETFTKNTSKETLRWGAFSSEKLEHHCCVGPHPMWRKTLHDQIGYFDEQYKSAGDYDFWLRASLHHPFLHVDDVLGLYYYSPDSLGNGGMNVYLETIDVQKRHQKRKQRMQGSILVEPMNLMQCYDLAEVQDLLNRRTLHDLFPDLYQEIEGDAQADAMAYLRVARRLLQINALGEALTYLKRSYKTMPMEQTRMLLETLGDTFATSTTPDDEIIPADDEKINETSDLIIKAD